MTDFRPETLAGTDRYLMTRYRQPSGSDTLVISFNPVGMDIAPMGFGSEFLLAKGFDHVHVAEAKHDFYQSLPWDRFAELIAPVLGDYDKVFTYGQSLGGYCALFYAAAAKARPVALAPKLPPHPYALRFQKNPVWAGTRIIHPDLPEVPRTPFDPVVCYDPQNPIDNAFVTEFVMPVYPGATLVPLDHAGHLVAKRLLRENRLKELVLSVFRTGDVPKIELDPTLLPDYNLKQAVDAMDRGDFDAARRCLDVVVAENPAKPPFIEIADYIERSGRGFHPMPRPRPQTLRKAFGRLDFSGDGAPKDALLRMAQAYVRLCDFDTALRLAETAAQLDPDCRRAQAMQKKLGRLRRIQARGAAPAD
ncbi:tetratricopeptide repeat protein [Ruixingdingia sedimenti]|uniref:Tetratricopeptide repeat protein n=1 Tax=Ruixingdingia sedimenti TaxID=3073604 RepID=A0ABU1F2C9_9RHOB|nr:tetratricopeptide repeat protein [Xinfangfangia sp. LG-4]MDR5651022.1 tetratricopeptide repeat protein [Xinfangfangia sp. LG-4]